MLWLDLAGCVEVGAVTRVGFCCVGVGGKVVVVVVGYITVPCSFGNGLQGYCCIVKILTSLQFCL